MQRRHLLLDATCEVAHRSTEVDHAPSMATGTRRSASGSRSTPATARCSPRPRAPAGSVVIDINKRVSAAGLVEFRHERIIIAQANDAAFHAVLGNIYQLHEGHAWPDGLVARIRTLQR